MGQAVMVSDESIAEYIARVKSEIAGHPFFGNREITDSLIIHIMNNTKLAARLREDRVKQFDPYIHLPKLLGIPSSKDPPGILEP